MPTTKTFKTTASLVGAHADGCRSECGKLKPRRGCFESDGRAIRRVGASLCALGKKQHGLPAKPQSRSFSSNRYVNILFDWDS